MKRILPAALALTLSLTACGGTNNTTSPAAGTSDTGSCSDTADTRTPAQTGSPETVPPVSGTPEAAASNTAAASEAPTESPDTSSETSAPLPAPETPEAPRASTPPEAPAQTESPAATEVPAEQATTASLTDIRDKMLSDLGISDYMEISPSRLLDLYGIQEADVAQSGSFATMSGAFPGEVILLEATDEAAAGRIAAALQNRLNEVLNQYKTYDAETYALAEACTIDTDGKIVSMLLSPEREGMLKILTDSLR